MSQSLQRRLSRTLGLSIVLAGLIAATTSFIVAYEEAEELQDDTLREVAVLTLAGILDAKAAAAQRANATNGSVADLVSRLLILRLPQDVGPVWLPADLRPGFHTLSEGSERMRVFVRELHGGDRIVVAQATDLRDEIALDSALFTLVPLLLVLPVLILLTTRIIRGELARVRQLAETLDRQSPERPQPLSETKVPEEVSAFVHAINRLFTRINHLMGEQRRFIADAAHELRGPLTALSVQVENLEKAPSLQAMHERILPLRAGIDRARRLSEQLLSLAKTQADIGDARVEVSGMARELIAEYVPYAEVHGIDLGLEVAAPLVVSATTENLRLVLKNALDNAMTYTAAHGQVTVRLVAEDEDAVIEVVDTGPGIPAAERERVFEPFYRMAGSPGDGSGLGLAIARDAATRMGGIVSLHDRPSGAGLVFRYRQRRIVSANT
ncbi:MAG TPA: ATP-binding protein [Burkholderiales bacterium]|nr:ATP-binding protein [Burkholderiales bacterium]